jgi:ABC-type nickel/cobalt efflux system permease component RcnA
VLHTLVPDHWLPIAVLARQRGWSKIETARAAAQAGSGHVVSTLVIAVVVWIAGSTTAKRYGAAIDTASNTALIGFGLWIAISAWRKEHCHRAHSHSDGATHTHRTDGKHGQAGAGRTAQRKGRTALLLIVGSSPMVEGIPLFFAAGGYGAGLIAVMAMVFAATTIATYLLLCVTSASQLQSLRFGAFERHGEALSGAMIAVVGLVFWVWPFIR